jgi:hypothetical protein
MLVFLPVMISKVIWCGGALLAVIPNWVFVSVEVASPRVLKV